MSISAETNIPKSTVHYHKQKIEARTSDAKTDFLESEEGRNCDNIFCDVDDFCKIFIPVYNKILLSNKKRIRKSNLEPSEIMTIIILFHLSGYRTFKWF